LESFSVIQRCAKNEYQWRGIEKIVHSIEKQINSCKENPAGDGNSAAKDNEGGLKSSSKDAWSSDEQQPAPTLGKRRRRPANGRAQKKVAKYKKVKSLGNFCLQFIRLFVTWKDVLSLEEAAKEISDGEVYDEKLLKTKIRRLYDIANVLQSIGLIHKTQMSNSRKPAFKWIGLKGVILAIEEIKKLVKTAQQELLSNY